MPSITVPLSHTHPAPLSFLFSLSTVVGILKGYDQLLNMVLDETVEYLRDSDDPLTITDDTRTLGLTVCRGTSVMVVHPSTGSEEIANPFVQQ